mmetsp:Transcript_58217/g.161335  ORF Transcript_58217/g.161335 Transcript_58217/m.161335 type:complete len:367 (-) Transcript_58217:466-1566(-)
MASRGAWLTATRGELRCGGACVRINHGVERCVADCDTQGRGANPELWGVLGGRRRSCVRAAAYDPLPLLLVQCPARAHLQLRYFTSVVMGRHRPASRCGRQTTGVAGGCVRDVWDGEVRCARDVLMHARRPRCSCLPRRRGTSGVLWGMPRGRTRSCVVVLLFERSRTYAVASRRREGAERVERDGIDRVDLARLLALHELLTRLPVALEGEVLVLLGCVDVLDGHAPLDRADRVARLVGERGDAARLVLERRRVHAVRLSAVLEGLQVERVHVAQLGRVLLPLVRWHVGRRHHHERRANVHGVDALRHRDRLDRVRLARVPKLHRVVPPARDHEPVMHLHVLDALDRLLVPPDRLRRGLAGLKWG